MDPQFVALGLFWYIAFLFSLTCHEAAHALVAKWGGDLTAAEGGQVTLNPLPHIRREIFGTIIVPILSYLVGGWMIGWGSAPYDPRWSDRHPHRAAWMALAGPATNFGLMLASVLVIRLGILAGALKVPEWSTFTKVVAATRPGPWEGLAVLISIMFSLNLLLGLFNLLPLPPLDGHGAICLLFTENFARRFNEATHNPSLSMVGLLVGWKVFGYVFDPAFTAALKLLYLGIS